MKFGIEITGQTGIRFGEEKNSLFEGLVRQELHWQSGEARMKKKFMKQLLI